MPIYEYKCRSCSQVTSILVRGFKDPEGLVCDQCGGKDLVKIVSPVHYHGSSSDRLNNYDPRARQGDSFYRDTRNIGLGAERMLKQAGIEPPDEFKHKLEKARTDPASIIKDQKP